MKNILSLLPFLLLVSCTFKTDDVDLREHGEFAGSYVAYGEDYEIETHFQEMENDIFKIRQGESIDGVGIRSGERLFLAIRDDSSFASGIYIIKEKSLDGVWTAGNPEFFTERLSKSGHPEDQYNIPACNFAIKSSVFSLNISSDDATEEVIMLIEPVGERTFDLLLEAESSFVSGFGICSENYISACLYDESLDSWGVMFLEFSGTDTLMGSISLFGDWSLKKAKAVELKAE